MFVPQGASKQNGFVEFSKTDEINEICRQLDGKILKSGTEVVCDVVLASVVDFEQLYASCLYVKHLPPDFTDDSLLQEKFSVIAKPLYCRVSKLFSQEIYRSFQFYYVSCLFLHGLDRSQRDYVFGCSLWSEMPTSSALTSGAVRSARVATMSRIPPRSWVGELMRHCKP